MCVLIGVIFVICPLLEVPNSTRCAIACVHHTLLIAAIEDIVPVATYLSPLMKEEVKTLGMLLGLSHSTIMNGYKCSSRIKYLDSIISAWFKKEDRVIQNGWWFDG